MTIVARARAGSAVIALAFGFGCEGEFEFIAYPEPASARSSLLLSPRSSTFYASAELSPIRTDQWTEDSELLMLGYEASLETLGLAEGAVSVSASCRACELLAPSQVFLRAPPEDWRDLGRAVPVWAIDALVPDHVARCSGCPTFESERLAIPELDGNNRLRLAPWDDESIVVIDPVTGQVLRLYASGMSENACGEPLTFLAAAVFRGHGADLWLIDNSGVVHRMDLDSLDPEAPCAAATSTHTPALGFWANALLVSLDPAGAVVHALFAPHPDQGQEAHLNRFEDGRWTRIYTFLENEGDPSMATDTAGTVYAVTGGHEIAMARGESVTVWKGTDASIPYSLTVVAHLPNWGPLAATRIRGLMRPRDGGDWVPIEAENTISLAGDLFGSIVPDESGLLLANLQGGLHYYSERSGYCDQQGLFGRTPGRQLMRLPDGTLFSAEEDLYRARPRQQACAP